ncbi:alpha/beta hydrolase-fold protein, partial [Persicitalea sp.]|uniref:alpha/beta hydrolase-fold protein n=1 Tax=Persicitalea sp. TaxID=3100273 RepID=UPI0035941251
MKKLLLLFLLGYAVVLQAQTPTEDYPADPASVEQAGVPKGEVLKFTFDQSKIFPGTWREVWVYVPTQYDPSKPACVYVNQDGIQWKATTVFDNLIHKKEMPVTIGVFVTPGRVIAQNPEEALDRFNRSYEYDGLGDNYARFILEEILPEVEKMKTSDGRVIHLSKNGNDRAIGGSSSGAVCAFTAAWERPNDFSRVFSAIGTYVGLRGADRYPTLIRKYEPKPLRVFLQDGENDLNIYAGDWWMANQMMLRALNFSGYEVAHVWGEGAHNGKHGTALFPDAMRYLWKGWPEPVKTSTSKNPMLTDVVVPGAGWELASGKYASNNSLVVDVQGELFFQDAFEQNKNYRVDAAGKTTDVPAPKIKQANAKFEPDPEIKVGGKALSPDQTQLYITDAASHWIWIYQVQPDGSLRHGQRYGWLHSPDT